MLGRTRRRQFIERYSFSPVLRTRLRAELEDGREVELALEGLRAWYLVCLRAKGEVLGMPSRVVDIAWHEMILMTREYHAFCDRAFGRYLHHHPQSGAGASMDDMLARTLDAVDSDEPRAGRTVDGIPFLFAVDAEVGIAEGQVWTPADLSSLRRTTAARRAADHVGITSMYGGSFGMGGCGGGGGDGGGGGGGGCGGGGG